MKSHRYRSTPVPKSDNLFRKPGEKEAASAFFSAVTPPTWAQRLQAAQAIANIRERLNALTLLVREALAPEFTVLERTAMRSENRNDCNFYAARSPDGTIVNFDLNQLESSKTYYCFGDDGKCTTRIVLGMKSLHPMGPAYTRMLNQHQQMLAKGMEAKEWNQAKPAPTNNEKLQAYLSNFTNFFFDLISFNLQTCTPRIAFKFDGLFVAYKEVSEDERAAAFKTIKDFYDSQIKGDTGNMIRFKIWLQTALNDAVIIPNPLALKINELPGLKLTRGDNPEKHICAK